MLQRFSNQIVLITGGSAGIGLETAESYAKEGATVVLADIQPEQGMEKIKDCQASGLKMEMHRVDVTQATEVAQFFQAAVDQYGKIDIAINNAGIEGSFAPVTEAPQDVFEQVFDVNVKGVWFCMKNALRFMVAQGYGSIVNIASVAGLLGVPGNGAYCASKHAVIGLTKTAALEYGRIGIRVNAICPSFIKTNMVTRSLSDPKTYAKMEAMNPTKRFGNVEEVAKAILWLSSKEASYVNGHSMPIDGGLTIS